MNAKHFSLLCCFLTLFSVVIGIITIATTSVPYVSAFDWGIASKLPPFYWVGLFSIFGLTYISRTSKKWLTVVFLLAILYLFIVPVAIQENATLLGISYPSSEGKLIGVTGHLIEDKSSIYKYHNFPGFLYLTAILTSVTGIPLTLLCKYAPIFLVVLLSLIVYLILRVKLRAPESIMGAMWFLGSWWWIAGNYFSPQAVSSVLFALAFLIFTWLSFGRKPQNRSLGILFIILVVSIVFSHPFTSIMLISCFIPLLLVQRWKTSGLIMSLLLLTLELSFLFLWAFPFAEYAISTTLQQVPNLLSSQFGRAQLIGSLPQISTNLSRYLIMITNVSVCLVFIALSILKPLKDKEKYWLLSIAGMCLPIAVTTYGMSETIIRVFEFALIPLTYLCVRLFAKKPRLLAVLVCMLFLVHIPAHYGGATVEGVATSGIAGASFYLDYVPRNVPYFSLTLKPTFLMWFQEPYSVEPPLSTNILLPINETAIAADLEQSKFVIYSQGDINEYIYYHGESPLQRSVLEGQFDHFYDNSYVQLFFNASKS